MKLRKQLPTPTKGNNMDLNVKNIGNVVGGLFLFALTLGSYSIVGPGERGVLVTLGKPSDTVLDEGPHFKFPFISSVKLISVRVQKTESHSEAATKDMQKVNATVALNWNLDPKTVNTMFRNVGDEHEISERIINPAVSEVLKAATAKMTAEEVLTRRMELKTTIDEMLTTRLGAYNVIIKDISLVNLNFTDEFNHAVEKKQIAEQEAKQAEYNAQRATQDAKATVNAAKGEAEASLTKARAQSQGQQLLRQTLTADVLQLEYLKKWDGHLPTVLAGSASGIMLNIKQSDTKAPNDKPSPQPTSEEVDE